MVTEEQIAAARQAASLANEMAVAEALARKTVNCITPVQPVSRATLARDTGLNLNNQE
jgi:hypothetical protein